ncbi:hypothetical protein [Citrobacter koseri]|nr:hypothetical protein [Citrobacter koseri]MDT7487281.1 hypothetical protein [Citrobacter koseri]
MNKGPGLSQRTAAVSPDLTIASIFAGNGDQAAYIKSGRGLFYLLSP